MSLMSPPVAALEIEDLEAALGVATAANDPAKCDAVRRAIEQEIMAGGWRGWLTQLYPSHCSHDFGEHHERFWDWVWSIEKEKATRPFVGIWARGGAIHKC